VSDLKKERILWGFGTMCRQHEWYDFVAGVARRDKQSLSNVKVNSRACVVLLAYPPIQYRSMHKQKITTNEISLPPVVAATCHVFPFIQTFLKS
jgi:hypothetical protein